MTVNKKLIYKWVFVISIALNIITVGYFIDRKVLFNYRRQHQFEKQRWQALFNTKSDSLEIIFIGTSLTEGFALQRSFNNIHLKNMGFGGAENRDILNNMERVIKRKPQKIFLETGINDIRNGRDSSLMYEDFVAMCTLAKKARRQLSCTYSRFYLL